MTYATLNAVPPILARPVDEGGARRPRRPESPLS